MAEQTEAPIIIKKKRRSGHAGGHSSSWKIAFADFVTAMMAFFLLMWLIATADEKEKQAITGYFTNPLAAISGEAPILLREMYSLTSPKQTASSEIGRSALEGFVKEEQAKTDSDDEDVTPIIENLAQSMQAGELEIDTNSKRIVIRITDNGTFASGSADLLPAVLPVLNKVAKVLQITPGKVMVSGYTDNIPIDTPIFRSNRELSAVRAVSVAEEILKNKKIAGDRFVIRGYGETEPLATNDTPEGRAKNRRVELELLQAEKPATTNKVLTIEKDADTKLLPNIEKIDKDDFSVFPPITDVDFDGNGEYLERGELGVFDKDALYNYELKDKIEKPTDKPKPDADLGLVDNKDKDPNKPASPAATTAPNNPDQAGQNSATKDASPTESKTSASSSTQNASSAANSAAEAKPADDLGLYKEPVSDPKQSKKAEGLSTPPEKEVENHDDLGIVKPEPAKKETTIQVDKDLGNGRH